MIDAMLARRLRMGAQVTGIALESLQRGDLVTAAFDYSETYDCDDCGSHPRTVVYKGFPKDDDGCLGYGFAGWDANEGDDIVVFGDRELMPKARMEREQ